MLLSLSFERAQRQKPESLPQLRLDEALPSCSRSHVTGVPALVSEVPHCSWFRVVLVMISGFRMAPLPEAEVPSSVWSASSFVVSLFDSKLKRVPCPCCDHKRTLLWFLLVHSRCRFLIFKSSIHLEFIFG